MPTALNLIPHILVQDEKTWQAMLKHLRGSSAIAIDLENNGFYRYPAQICLIQLALLETIFIVDPLVIRNLTPLGEILVDPHIVKVFHACENDLRFLFHAYQFKTKNIFDTALAAHFLNLNQLGLVKVLKHCLNIDIPKSKALQRQDWSLRPLPAESLHYAISDVAYLLDLKRFLEKQLQHLGRLDWVREECQLLEKSGEKPPQPLEEGFLKIKGCQELKPKQRAILKELFLFRDQQAREFNRPPFYIVSNETLLLIAKNARLKLSAQKGLIFLYRRGKLKQMAAAIHRGQKRPGIMFPVMERPLPPSDAAIKIYQLLKKWRIDKGLQLGLNPSLVWPLKSLMRLALHSEENESQPTPDPEVRNWQKINFFHELEGVLCQSKS